jgi:hypothetical protein
MNEDMLELVRTVDAATRQATAAAGLAGEPGNNAPEYAARLRGIAEELSAIADLLDPDREALRRP